MKWTLPTRGTRADCLSVFLSASEQSILLSSLLFGSNVAIFSPERIGQFGEEKRREEGKEGRRRQKCTSHSSTRLHDSHEEGGSELGFSLYYSANQIRVRLAPNLI